MTATCAWLALRYVLIDWTVTTRMLRFNEKHPFLYQFVTVPVVVLEFGMILFFLFLVLEWQAN